MILMSENWILFSVVNSDKAPTVHNHDDRYYTEEETISQIRLVKKIYQGELTFSSGIGSVSIQGSEDYGIAIAENISSNEHCIYRVIHNLGSTSTTLVARKQDGNVFDGSLTVVLVFL